MDNQATPLSISSLNHATTRDDVVQTSKTVHDAWYSEIKGKIHSFDGNYAAYLNKLVPCVTPLPPQISSALKENGGPFANFQPVKGGEVASYPDLVDGLTQLVSLFPDAKKLMFVDSNSLELKFPYAAFAHNHHPSKPDISVSWPGAHLDREEVQNSQWEKIIIVLEVKPFESNDSFQAHKKGKSNEATIIQVVRNARTLMHTHGLLYCFVLGIYGEIVRIARFDHSCGIVCKAFNIKTRKGAGILQRFFWHFVNPAAEGPVVGCDPTAHRLTDQDKQWVRNCLVKRSDPDADDAVFAENIRHGKRLLVYDEQTGKRTWYIAYKPIDINARLFSRATRVWRTIEDTRVEAKDGNLIADRTKKNETPRVRILKESWRQLVRRSEGSFYQRLQSKIPKDQSRGLTRMVCGGDLGQMEVLAWEPYLPGGLKDDQRNLRLSLGPYAMPPLPIDDTSDTSDTSDAPALPGSSVDPSGSSTCGAAESSTGDRQSTVSADNSLTTLESTDPTTAPAVDRPSTSPGTLTITPTTPSHTSIPGEALATDYHLPFYLPFPQQQTFSWAFIHGGDYSYRERSHMRFVMEHVGRPITEFKSTFELVRALYDAIIGHKKAYELAGVLHRDISVGNILILDDPDEDGPTGFLLDFDYSSIFERVVEPKGANTTNSKSNTTTQPTNTDNCAKNTTATSKKKIPRKTVAQMNAQEYEAFFQSRLQPPVERACQKERTGTYYFMAVELLKASGIVIHEPRHDLESFYWVLLWVVLRHTLHTLGQKQCADLFTYGDNQIAAEKKRAWVSRTDSDSDTGIQDDPQCLMTRSRPLTELLEGFRLLVRSNVYDKSGLTYSSVLELFETALKAEDWPADDWVECTLLDFSKTRPSMMSNLGPSRGNDAFVLPRLPSVLNSIPNAKPALRTIRPLPRSSTLKEALPDSKVRRSAPSTYLNQQEETPPTRPKRRRGEHEVEDGASKSEASRLDEAGPPVAGPSRVQSWASSLKGRKMVSGPAPAMTLRSRRPRTPPSPVS